MRIEILPDSEALANAAADLVADWLSDRSHRTVGLAGGSTPRGAYERLRRLDLEWERVIGWMTDERHVPIDHPDSNAGMAMEALFDHVPATLEAVPHANDPLDSARQYRDQLTSLLPDGDAGLVLLGMGDDGHTASLFPGTEALAEQELDYVANRLATGSWRLTATFPLLARAARTVFVVAGAAKADRLAEVMSGQSHLPAAIVARISDDPIWLVDQEAAAELG